MKPFVLSAAVISLTLTLTAQASAQQRTFAVAPNTSTVHMTLNTNHDSVNGTFHVQSGSISYDNNAHTIAGDVIVAASSGDTGNKSRDKKMNKDILDTEKYTTVTFAPKSYTGSIPATGDSTIQVSGIFTLLGTPHPITIPMQIHIAGNACVAKANFAVPYVQWGAKDPSFFVLKAEKQVDIDLVLNGSITQ